MTEGRTADGRRVYRFTFDVLAAPHQVDGVVALVGRALCGADDGHTGPCLLAWAARRTDGESLVGGDLGRADLRDLRDELAAVDVLPAAAVDRHLGLGAGSEGLRRTLRRAGTPFQRSPGGAGYQRTGLPARAAYATSARVDSPT